MSVLPAYMCMLDGLGGQMRILDPHDLGLFVDIWVLGPRSRSHKASVQLHCMCLHTEQTGMKETTNS